MVSLRYFNMVCLPDCTVPLGQVTGCPDGRCPFSEPKDLWLPQQQLQELDLHHGVILGHISTSQLILLLDIIIGVCFTLQKMRRSCNNLMFQVFAVMTSNLYIEFIWIYLSISFAVLLYNIYIYVCVNVCNAEWNWIVTQRNAMGQNVT